MEKESLLKILRLMEIVCPIFSWQHQWIPRLFYSGQQQSYISKQHYFNNC